MNFDDIVKPSPGLCRCCLSEGCYKDLGTEYSWMNDTEVYADMLLDCFDIGITQHNDGPNGPKRLICEVCITRLRDACNFKKQVLDSEKKFIDMLGRGEFKSKVLSYQPEMKAESIEVPIEEPYLTDVEYLEDNIEYEDSEEVIKTEEPSTSQPTTSDREARPKRGRPKKPDAKPEKSPKPAKIAKVAKGTVSAADERRRENIKLILNYTSIIPFTWKEHYICFYCGIAETDYTTFRKHTKSHGLCSDKSLKDSVVKIDVSDISCEICETEFESMELILDHLTSEHSKIYHKNIDIALLQYRLRDFKCVNCVKDFNNFRYLEQHTKDEHLNAERQNTCDLCLKTFVSSNELTLHTSNCHMKTKEPPKTEKMDLYIRIRKNIQCVINMSTAVPFKFKGKFICFYCPQPFVDCDEVISHTRTEHPICELKSRAMKGCRSENPRVKIDINHLACKLCLQPMTDLTTFVDHAIEKHEAKYDKSISITTCFEPFQLTQSGMPCLDCGQTFTYFATLQRHIGTEHSDRLKCVYCERSFRGATSLNVHISNAHTGTCECSICGTKCKNSPTLASHMAQYHGTKGFKCSLCSELFETVYKKKKHLIDVHNIGHKCSYCPSMFTKYSYMVNHEKKTHSTERTVTECRRKNLKLILNYTSIIPFNWKEHFKCFYCEYVETDYTKFRKHTKSHGLCTENSLKDNVIKIDVSEIVCKICETEFESLKLILDHLTNEHSKIYHKNIDTAIIQYRLCDFKCVTCDKQFKELRYLIQHTKDEHPNTECHNTCDFCFTTFTTSNELTLHFSNCDMKTTEPPKSEKMALYERIRKNIQCVINMSTAVPFKFKTKFRCFYCTQPFVGFDEVISHTQTEHPFCELKSRAIKGCRSEKPRVKIDVNRLSCKLCLQPMTDLTTFVDHAIENHEAKYDKSISITACFEPFRLIENSMPCPDCGQTFTYFATLLRHIGTEHSHSTICVYCGRGFRSATSLNMHISNSHTGMCECSICGTKCKNSATLARHMALYHDAKDFKCSQCPELFQTVTKRNKHHIEVHNIGYKCSYCGSMFAFYSRMVNHVKMTHLKERTVPCSICDLKFFDQKQMKLHMVKHDGERRFRCDICQ